MRATTDHEVTTRVAGCVAGHYEATEVPFGIVYRWCPGRVVVECRCGERPALFRSGTACGKCGADHAPAVSKALDDERLKDEDLRPWRYAGDREEIGIPC